MALEEAASAGRSGEVPVGAVLVRGGEVISRAGNASVRLSDPTAHAEVNALRGAGAALGNYRLPGCVLYVTLEPCCMCAGALVHARVDRVVFGCADPAAGAAGSMANLLQTPFLNHRCDIVSGVLEGECRSLLEVFFSNRRQAT